jgi:hypothetical protein
LKQRSLFTNSKSLLIKHKLLNKQMSTVEFTFAKVINSVPAPLDDLFWWALHDARKGARTSPTAALRWSREETLLREARSEAKERDLMFAEDPHNILSDRGRVWQMLLGVVPTSSKCLKSLKRKR